MKVFSARLNDFEITVAANGNFLYDLSSLWQTQMEFTRQTMAQRIQLEMFRTNAYLNLVAL
jgi:hypothetical protein